MQLLVFQNFLKNFLFFKVSEVVFNNVPVDDSLMLGESENAGAMVDELAYSGKTLYGAAVVGFMKKALGC